MKIELSEPWHETIKGKEYWYFYYPSEGKRKKIRRRNKADAFDEYEKRKTELKLLDKADALTNAERIDTARAVELLRPHGINIYVEAQRINEEKKTKLSGVPLSKAITRFIENREIRGCTKQYIDGLKNRLGFSDPKKNIYPRPNSFAKKYPNATVKEITPEIIYDFLEAFRKSPGYANSLRNELCIFFSYCTKMKFIDDNPVTRTDKFKYIPKEPEILTPAQCRELLKHCPDEILCALVVQMFCGLRAAEASRLHYKAIYVKHKVIFLNAEIVKTTSRRPVQMNDTAAAWLMPYQDREGPVMPANYRDLFDIVRVKSGFRASRKKRKNVALQAALAEAKAQKRKLIPWPKNALRRTAISYTLALNEDLSKTARSAGNSPTVITKHYDALAFPDEAAEFFNILPEQAQTAAEKAKIA